MKLRMNFFTPIDIILIDDADISNTHTYFSIYTIIPAISNHHPLQTS